MSLTISNNLTYTPISDSSDYELDCYDQNLMKASDDTFSINASCFSAASPSFSFSASSSPSSLASPSFSFSTSSSSDDSSSSNIASPGVTTIKTARFSDTLRVNGPARSYIPPTEAAQKRMKAQIRNIYLSTETRGRLYQSFFRTKNNDAPSTLCRSWANDVLSTLVSYFDPQSFRTLGSGANSSAYVMESSGQKQVVRLFSYYQLSHSRSSPQFRLTRTAVGGEWLSLKISGDHLTSNSHLIVWNPKENTFKVLDQKQANALIDSRQRMKNGEELYVVGTVGNYIEGSQDLSQVLEKTGPMTEEKVQGIMRQVLTGILNLHKQGIIYRDLKPENLILLPNGKVNFIDFGTAALYQGKALPPIGDRTILPYESFGLTEPGRTDDKTDVYGVHTLAYKLLTGKNYCGLVRNLMQVKSFQSLARTKEETTPLITSLAKDCKLQHVSAPMLQLMASLGTSFASKRMNAKEALEHSIFKKRDIVAA